MADAFEGHPATASTQDLYATSATGRCRVLVIEDVDTTRRRIVDVLRRSKYHVEVAADGLEALNIVSARHFDAILLDLILPNVDGWQFRQTQLRHPELAGIPTVVVTRRPLPEAARYALQVEDVIQKPFDDALLLGTVAKACRRVQPAVAPPTPRPGQLFWSRHGEVACLDHAPLTDSVRWHGERWTALPEGVGKHQIVYQCQYCGDNRGPVRHRRRSPKDV